MKESTIDYKGIVDKERNPFSVPSWCREGSPEGSGRAFQQTAFENFQKVLDKGGRIADIKEPHYEKYATFQAIRWGYAVKEGDRIILTKEGKRNGLRSSFNVTSEKNMPEEVTSSLKENTFDSKQLETQISHSNAKLNPNRNELIEVLKGYDLNATIIKYLNADNLKNKSPHQIFKNHTFGNSISRAFHHESPSIQYQQWADKININDVLTSMKNITTQKEYYSFLYKIALSLENSWNDKNENGGISKMNIGISLKIMNLLMKHLTFVHLKDNTKLISYLHVPWDKFTLHPLKNIWTGNPKIDSSSSQGFVKNERQYLELHDLISSITSQAGVDRIAYEFWAWDKEH